MSGYFPGLVRLQGPDEVPFDRQVLQLRLLVQRLLHVIFAERGLPELVQGAYPVGWMLLADGQNGDCRGLAAGLFAGFGDPCTDILKIYS